MTDALKELFNAYKHLPIGVMFFKEEKLFFVNDHLRSVLLLQNLDSDNMIDIIGAMLGLENVTHESLCTFLSSNDFFLYRDQYMQINREHFDGIDVVVILRLSDESINAIDQTRFLRELRHDDVVIPSVSSEEQHQMLDKAFVDWKNSRFSSMVLYKGIPIKADCTIVHAHAGEIGIRVGRKQLSAAQTGALWLFGNKKKVLSGEVSHYDLSQSVVWLTNLQIAATGFHMRRVIRYRASEEDQIHFLINGKKYVSPLQEISEKGISIYTEDTALLLALSSSKGETLNAELILSDSKIAVKAVWLYTTGVKSEKKMKAALMISYEAREETLLREWLTDKQLHLIKEIHTFTEMVPPPQESTADWII
jgi:hypothetical protein